MDIVVTWLVEYCAALLNLRERWKTTYERLNGKRGVVFGVEFVKKSMFNQSRGQRGAQTLSRLWSEVIFV